MTKLVGIAIVCAFAVTGMSAQGTSSQTNGSPAVENRILAGPVAQNVTDHSAIIFWVSSGEASASVRFGNRPEDYSQTAKPLPPRDEKNAGREHRAELSNLEPDRTYYFQIVNSEGSVETKGQFQTEPSGFAHNGLLAIIDGPVFEYLDSNSVQIAWTTNSQSSTMVRYGTDPNDLNKTAQAPWGQQTHRVTIGDLKPNMKYYFVVESAQAKDSGTMAKSAEGAFQTEQQGEAALTDIEPRR